jgi:translation initiation factor IF-2
LQGKYIEVSAKDGMNIVELFDLVIEGVEQMNKVSLPMIS